MSYTVFAQAKELLNTLVAITIYFIFNIISTFFPIK